jgi:hypothetical protein
MHKKHLKIKPEKDNKIQFIHHSVRGIEDEYTGMEILLLA